MLILVHATTALGAPGTRTVNADLAGDGKSQTYKLELKFSPEDKEYFESASVRLGADVKSLPDDFTGYEAEFEAFPISGESKRKVLIASAIGESDWVVRVLFTLVDGKLKQVGRVDGQGDIALPGNGTLTSKSWMGFWTRTEKHVFDADFTVSVLAQEFYSVDVEGTVTRTFPVYQKRDGKGVLANTRAGSKFKVLLWDAASRKVVDDVENIEDQWYLIRTESGFTGWVRQKHLMEDAVLPWAG